MAVTQKEIINLALNHLAVAPLVSTDEGSVASLAALRVWDSARKESLRGHDWSFGTVVATLTISATYATLSTSALYAGSWIYAYTYPSDCLALWRVYNESKADKSVSEDFRELYDSTNSQRVVVTNVYEALGEYTFDVTDPAYYDANFVRVLSYKLAADMAISLTGDPKLFVTMDKKFNELMSEAERSTSYENNPDKVVEGTSAFVDARGDSEESSSYFNPNNPHLNG